MRIKSSAEAWFLRPRRGGEGWRGGLKKTAQNRISYFNCFLLIYLIHKNKQTMHHIISSHLLSTALLCNFQDEIKTRGWKKQQNHRYPRELLGYLQCCHPHTLPPVASQAAKKQEDAHLATDRFSPFTRRACNLLQAGARFPQPALLTVTAHLASDHSSPAFCLQALLAVPHLNASLQQPGKRDSDTQGSRPQGVVFLALGTQRPARPSRTLLAFLPLCFLTVFITHVLKTVQCASEPPLCSSQRPGGCLQFEIFTWNKPGTSFQQLPWLREFEKEPISENRTIRTYRLLRICGLEPR